MQRRARQRRLLSCQGHRQGPAHRRLLRKRGANTSHGYRDPREVGEQHHEYIFGGENRLRNSSGTSTSARSGSAGASSFQDELHRRRVRPQFEAHDVPYPRSTATFSSSWRRRERPHHRPLPRDGAGRRRFGRHLIFLFQFGRAQSDGDLRQRGEQLRHEAPQHLRGILEGYPAHIMQCGYLFFRATPRMERTHLWQEDGEKHRLPRQRLHDGAAAASDIHRRHVLPIRPRGDRRLLRHGGRLGHPACAPPAQESPSVDSRCTWISASSLSSAACRTAASFPSPKSATPSRVVPRACQRGYAVERRGSGRVRWRRICARACALRASAKRSAGRC